MKTTYLKVIRNFSGGMAWAICLHKKGEIYVSEDSIQFNDIESAADEQWFRKEWKAVDSNKEEFDAFYKKTVETLNNIIKEL
jgi:hypothetical protein